MRQVLSLYDDIFVVELNLNNYIMKTFHLYTFLRLLSIIKSK